MAIALVDIEEAAARIDDYAVRTPLLQSAQLNEDCRRRVFVKPESLQITGSFKFRGALNRLSQLSNAERAAGVVAWSSGNHAQGVAAAAKIVETHAAIVMPADAPVVKIERTRRLNAEIIFYNRYTESREKIATEIAQDRGATLVPSYDDKSIIAGQGTVGLEIVEDLRTLGEPIDAALICCGGGGLAAGSAVAIKALSPDTAIFSVEPADYDDHARSLKTGRIEAIKNARSSICDALLAPQPGTVTFPINAKLLAGGLVVSDEEVKAAVRYAFEELKLILEPSGAVALAALLSKKLESQYKSVAIILSGGNVDLSVFADIISGS